MRVRDCFVVINNLRLRYREWGESGSTPVLLLHGGSAHAHWWDLFAATIADRYHACALDLRGHGDSEHAHPPSYRLDDYVDDLAKFVTALGFEHAVLVGHSLGAMVATAYSAQAATVRALVVVDSALRITPAGARYMARLHRFPQPMYRTHEDALRRFRLLPTQTNAAPAVLEYVAAHAIQLQADGRWTLKFDREALADHEPRDLTPALQRLRCPLLFVRGQHSTLLSPAALAMLRASVPHAQAAEISQAHHHVMLDNPSEFARVVGAFIDSAIERPGMAR